MTTDTSEKGLETLMRHMTGVDGFAVAPSATAKNPEPAGTGYFAGSPKDFDRVHTLPHGLRYPCAAHVGHRAIADICHHCRAEEEHEDH